MVEKTVTTNPDPTLNVIALNEAANRRQDDLRIAESLRIDQLRAAESRRVDEQLALRAEYDEKLRNAEAKRIDAIRAVDVNAVSVASQRASDQATVLANQVSQSADALRNLVQSTAQAAASAQAALHTALSDRITKLEQTQYEGKGKSAYVDPMLEELVKEMKRSRETTALTFGSKTGRGEIIAYLISAVSITAVIIGALFSVLHNVHP